MKKKLNFQNAKMMNHLDSWLKSNNFYEKKRDLN